MKAHTQTLLLSAAVALLLTACGGSDDNDGGSAPPTTKNQTPMAKTASFTTVANTGLKETLSGSDADDDSLTFILASDPANGEVSVNKNGDFMYTPKTDYTGSDSFTFTVFDGTNSSPKATVNINIAMQEVDFSRLSRSAFKQSATDYPLPLKGRNITQDVTEANAYSDLLQ